MVNDSQRRSLDVDPRDVAAAILDAAGWARVGIALPDERLRLKAAEELALSVVERIDPKPCPDPRQLTFLR